MITAFYQTLFYQPIFNALIGLYVFVPGRDLGIAIVLVTIAIRLLLYPLSVKSIRAQKAMQDLQPKLQQIKEQFKNDRQKQAEETMKLYREEKINPLSSCLPLLLQLPFLIAFFQVLHHITDPTSLSLLYSFIPRPDVLNPIAFNGLLDLRNANPIIAVLAGLAQFWQGHLLVRQRPKVKAEGARDEDFATLVNQQMTYMMPIVTVVIAWQFPSGLGLYWFLSTFLLALQQWFLFRKTTPIAPHV